MADEVHENGTNGTEVPEIELIIKVGNFEWTKKNNLPLHDCGACHDMTVN